MIIHFPSKIFRILISEGLDVNTSQNDHVIQEKFAALFLELQLIKFYLIIPDTHTQK